jgi:hypothetical protein
MHCAMNDIGTHFYFPPSVSRNSTHESRSHDRVHVLRAESSNDTSICSASNHRQQLILIPRLVPSNPRP